MKRISERKKVLRREREGEKLRNKCEGILRRKGDKESRNRRMRKCVCGIKVRFLGTIITMNVCVDDRSTIIGNSIFFLHFFLAVLLRATEKATYFKENGKKIVLNDYHARSSLDDHGKSTLSH